MFWANFHPETSEASSFGRCVIRSLSARHRVTSSEKLQKLGCFSKQKYLLFSLKHPSFYSFSEEEEC
jgi:hypothetical protein